MITTTNEKLVDVLNDLVEINNDRVTGYIKAAGEAKSTDVDLEATFHKMADDSRKYAAELTQRVKDLGGEPSTGTTNSGKVYRVWMDVKATFTGNDRKAILENCEFGEDAAQKAYKMALGSDAEIDADSRQLITDQQSSLKTAHDLIKKYRDAQ
ncbi:PA2169 family four-helix-bundle protein [soil metagenome]